MREEKNGVRREEDDVSIWILKHPGDSGGVLFFGFRVPGESEVYGPTLGFHVSIYRN